MTITAAYRPTPLVTADANRPFVDTSNGLLTQHGAQFLQRLRNYVNGGNRITPCSASGTNVITLTPNDASPLLTGYIDYEVFAFVAENTSTGAVTATVVPASGTLATVKVYKDGGATQAGSGDVVQNALYLATFNDALDSGSGGLVLAGVNTGLSAPTSAQYLTLATSSGLTSERVFTPNSTLSATDGGAGSTYTLGVNPNLVLTSLAVGNGTVTAPAIAASADSNTGIYWSAADAIAVTVGGAATLELTTAAITLAPAGSARLQVTATTTVSINPYYGPDGSASAPSYSFQNDADTGAYSSAADEFAIATGGTQRAKVTSTGAVLAVPVLAAAGSASAPAYSFNGDGNTGMYAVGADDIAFATGGSARFEITSTQIATSGVVGLWAQGGLIAGATTTALGNTWIKIEAGTTAYSQMNFASSTAPTSPANGDLWFDGSDLRLRAGGTTYTLTKT